jgi:hypothetical protein
MSAATAHGELGLSSADGSATWVAPVEALGAAEERDPAGVAVALGAQATSALAITARTAA